MYATEVDGQKLTLQVSGKLWMRSLIMSDVETSTEWSHLLGRAMAGKLKGKELEPLVTDMVTWGVWKEQHPQTTVMNLPPTAKQFTADFYKSDEKFLYGFVVDGKAWALPLESMQDKPIQQFECEKRSLVATYDTAGTVVHLFDRSFEGATLTFEKVNDLVMKDKATGSRWELLNGQCINGEHKGKSLKPLPGIMSFRRAWDNFHPDSVDVD